MSEGLVWSCLQTACLQNASHDLLVHRCPCWHWTFSADMVTQKGPRLFPVGGLGTRKQQHITCSRALFHEGAGSAQGIQSPRGAPCCLCLVAWSSRSG